MYFGLLGCEAAEFDKSKFSESLKRTAAISHKMLELI